ncbi:MAG: Aminopeptidase 2 [Ignavibacteria bacterium]|nr:Aminopeptidase 2 [Ignavibacteria bacterium]
MEDNTLKKYCELIINAGVNLYEDQCLSISSGIKNASHAYMLAEKAYENGAKYVDISFHSNTLTRHRINNTVNSSNFGYFPNYHINRGFELISNDWAHVKIDNLEELDDLKGIDSEKLGLMLRNEQENMKAISKSVSSSRISWCVTAFPGPVWAAKVYGTSMNGKSEENLWNSLIKILRLDKPDPVKEWMTFAEKLKSRGEELTKMKLEKLIFEGEETNLEIYLNENSVWKGGVITAANGRKFIPNLPTEEVFTTPDFRKTKGKVKVTKPVKVLENLLNDIWFEFKNGKVVDYGSDAGKKILDQYFSIDEGSSYLGEVALVDSSSEIFRSGLVFNSILYDENAACHIALGRGITSCFSNSEQLLNQNEMNKNGCNYSLVHTDFMIGSDSINVTGKDKSGNKIEIIKSGKFVI